MELGHESHRPKRVAAKDRSPVVTGKPALPLPSTGPSLARLRAALPPERLRSITIGVLFFVLYGLLDALVYRRAGLGFESAMLSLNTGLSYILVLAFGATYLPCVIVAPVVFEWLLNQTALPLALELPRDLMLGLSSALTIRTLLHRSVRFDPTLNSLRSIVLLFTAACVDSLLAAFVWDGTRVIAHAAGEAIVWRNVADLWIARFTGIVLVAPFGILLLRGRWTSLRTSDWVLHIGAIVLLFGSLILFGGPQPFAAFYLFLLPIVWMATRGGLEAASVGLVSTQIGLIIATWLLPYGALDVVALQSRLLVLSLTGLVVGAIMVERLRFEQQLRIHQDALARMARFASMSQLASSIAHEINQPLMAAGTYARLVTKALSDRPADRDIWTAADKADAQIRRAGDVIQRLRALFKLDRSDYRLHDLADILRSAVELCQAELEHRAVTCRVTIPERLPAIPVDRLQIEQVLVNLIQNSAQAIGASGRIQITARRGRKDSVEIVIADTGPGLPPDLIDGRPVPFFTTKADGIGVGLALSRSIVEAHGGELILSNGTKGAQVTILLPQQMGRENDGESGDAGAGR